MNPMSWMVRRARRSLAAALVGVVGVTAAVASSVSPVLVAPQVADAATPGSALVLYDTTGPYAFLGEQYAMLTANLASQFGTWTAKPVAQYTAGMMNAYTGVIYIGTTYDEPIPAAFLDDVLTGTKRVLWMNSNIWQLTNRQFAKTGEYWANVRGWDWLGYDTSSVAEVSYKGRSVGRYAADQSGILATQIFDPTKATAVAVAKRADGTQFPWATRSGNLTYLGETPLSYVSENNRYLILADLLFDLLDPTRAERHRALARIEDVSPASDPAELRAVADVLAAERVPFSVTVIPEYRDPKGVYNGGVREVITLAQAPQVVSALKYMVSKGGTLIMHGWTHQFDGIDNPYNQVSGDDTEFFRLFVDPATDKVVFAGALPNDSKKDAADRIKKGKAAFSAAKLTVPTIFTPPHYAASAASYQAIKDGFRTRYDRGLYFNGQLRGGAVSTTQFVGQFFPYPVTDVHGSRVVPENLGNEEPDEFNLNPPRSPEDIIASAQANLMVRDGFASFFWHPYLVGDPRVGTAHLRQIVQGIKALGYGFVTSTSVATAANTYTLLTPKAAGTPTTRTPAAGGAVQPAVGSPVTTVASIPTATNRKPVEPPVNLGEQLALDPDEGPVLTTET